MPPKKSINNDAVFHGGEPSAAAGKRTRKRNFLLNGIATGVPSTMTEFPSRHLLRQPPSPLPPTTDLQLSPPKAGEDEHFSSLIAQQNFIISAQMTNMQRSLEGFWQRAYMEEVKKRKETEAVLQQREQLLKQKDQQISRFLKMSHFYEEKSVNLEQSLEELRRKVVAGREGSSTMQATQEEVVDSSFFDPKSVELVDISCKNCGSRPAAMLWYPCLHLCVCFLCENKIKLCPICNVQKAGSLMVALPMP